MRRRRRAVSGGARRTNVADGLVGEDLVVNHGRESLTTEAKPYVQAGGSLQQRGLAGVDALQVAQSARRSVVQGPASTHTQHDFGIACHSEGDEVTIVAINAEVGEASPCALRGRRCESRPWPAASVTGGRWSIGVRWVVIGGTPEWQPQPWCASLDAACVPVDVAARGTRASSVGQRTAACHTRTAHLQGGSVPILDLNRRHVVHGEVQPLVASSLPKTAPARLQQGGAEAGVQLHGIPQGRARGAREHQLLRMS